MGDTPDAILDRLRTDGMGQMEIMEGMPMSDVLGGDAGDVSYPHVLANGRLPGAPEALDAVPGQRVRLRLVNAAADTASRVAVCGHRMTVTHSARGQAGTSS